MINKQLKTIEKLILIIFILIFYSFYLPNVKAEPIDTDATKASKDLTYVVTEFLNKYPKIKEYYNKRPGMKKHLYLSSPNYTIALQEWQNGNFEKAADSATFASSVYEMNTGEYNWIMEIIAADCRYKTGDKPLAWIYLKSADKLTTKYKHDLTNDNGRLKPEFRRWYSIGNKLFKKLRVERKKIMDKLEKGMVRVESGCYNMGDGPIQLRRRGSKCFEPRFRGLNRPVHEVCVKSFMIGKTEVTQEQFRQVLMSDLSHDDLGNSRNWYLEHLFSYQLSLGTGKIYPPKGDKYPVEENFKTIQKFISKLNKITGKKYRLPTEAEWEYVAVLGGGDKVANEESYYHKKEKLIHGTHPVAQGKPNKIGLYDLYSNAGEACQDWYSELYYHNSPRQDPKGPNRHNYTEFIRYGCEVDCGAVPKGSVPPKRPGECNEAHVIRGSATLLGTEITHRTYVNDWQSTIEPQPLNYSNGLRLVLPLD